VGELPIYFEEKGNSNIFAYADDKALLENTEEDVKRLCGKLLSMSEKVGLYVNDEETEYTVISCQGKKYQQGQFMNVEVHIFIRMTHLSTWFNF